MRPMIHPGACHCGDIRVAFETALPDTAPLRACQCSFCRRHGARTTSDPAGRLTITSVRALAFYRFASRTADVVICPRCGVYLASSIGGPTGRVATLNVVGAQLAAFEGRAATPISYDGESGEDKRARRLALWTPTEIAVDDARTL
jgi:hypothetical protein